MAVNPYLQNQADAITQQYNQNLNNNIQGINSNAIAAGGFGGSRQGIAQGQAIGQSNLGLGSALASLYGNAYDADQNRQLQQQSLNNQYSLGLGNLQLGQTQAANNYSLGQQQNANTATANQNNYNLGLGNLALGQRAADTSQYSAETNRGLGYGQLQQAGDQNAFNNQLAGYNAQLNAYNALNNYNNLGLTWANQQQQTPIQNLTSLTNIGSTIGGQGGTSTTPYYGNSVLGGLSGAGLGSSIWNQIFGG